MSEPASEQVSVDVSVYMCAYVSSEDGTRAGREIRDIEGRTDGEPHSSRRNSR